MTSRAPAVSLSRPPAASRPVEGVLWMLGSGLSFVAVNGIVRHLGTDIPAAQSAFLRFAFGVVFVAPALLALRHQSLPARVWWLFGLRGLVHSAAVLCWFFAMARLPIAEVTAIGYLTPILVTLGGALLFRESFSSWRIGAVVVAVIGAAVVLRPGIRDLSGAHLSQLTAALFFAASYLTAKRLTGLAGIGTIVALLSLSVAVVLLPVALLVWQPVTTVQLGWLAVVAACATLAHVCMTQAFRAAPLTVTQPVTFLQLVWASLMGVVAFGEAVDPFVILGGGLIIAAIFTMTWRDARRSRAAMVVPASGD